MATSGAPATQTKEKETLVWSDDEAECYSMSHTNIK